MKLYTVQEFMKKLNINDSILLAEMELKGILVPQETQMGSKYYTKDQLKNFDYAYSIYINMCREEEKEKEKARMEEEKRQAAANPMYGTLGPYQMFPGMVTPVAAVSPYMPMQYGYPAQTLPIPAPAQVLPKQEIVKEIEIIKEIPKEEIKETVAQETVRTEKPKKDKPKPKVPVSEDGFDMLYGIMNNDPLPETRKKQETEPLPEVVEQPKVCKHKWKTKSETLPDCEKDGLKTEECSLCKETKETILPALKHDFKEEKKEPTCTEEGYTVKICSHCKKENERKKTECLGHDYKELITLKPTSMYEGEKELTCSRCKDRKKETIPKIIPKGNLSRLNAIMNENADNLENHFSDMESGTAPVTQTPVTTIGKRRSFE